MSISVLELLLHPVRIRIVNAMSGGRQMTTAQLAKRLPEISQATLYRHIAILHDGGILEVVKEQQARGAIERTFRLCTERSRVEPRMGKAMSLDDHRHGFTSAMAALIAEFNSYLGQKGADPYADSVSYRQGMLWLSERELADLIDGVRNMLIARSAHEPSPERRPYLVSTILFPTEPRRARTPAKRARRSRTPE